MTQSKVKKPKVKKAVVKRKKTSQKKLTVEQYWKKRGVDYESVSKLIDMYPEGSDMSETAKDLVSLLDDHSFDDYDSKTNETHLDEDEE